MSANPRAVMANSWLRWAYVDHDAVLVITAAYVGDEMQFLATIKPVDGPAVIIPYRRRLNADPLTVAIPLRPGKTFVFDETVHDLTNVADAEVFRALHQSAVDDRRSSPEDPASRSAKRFQVIDGGKS